MQAQARSGTPVTKLSQLKAQAANGDWNGAIRMAAKFQNLGEERKAILDAHMALTNPGFCMQLKKSPHDLIEAGKAALRSKYGI